MILRCEKILQKRRRLLMNFGFTPAGLYTPEKCRAPLSIFKNTPKFFSKRGANIKSFS